MKNLIAFFVALALCVTLSGCSKSAEPGNAATQVPEATATPEPERFTSGDWEYVTLEDDTLMITDFRNSGASEAEIPEELDGKKVTTIGPYAFQNLKSLRTVRIPSGVTRVEGNVFMESQNLAEISVAEDHPTLESAGGVLYSKTGRTAIAFAGAAPGASSVSIREGTERIGDYAFYNCRNLEEVRMPDSVTVIGVSAFNHCSHLKTVVFPQGLTDIGDRAFDECHSLAVPELPGGVVSIGDGAFGGCPEITAVRLPDSVTFLGKNPFLSCRSLAEFTVSETHPYLETDGRGLYSKPDRRLIAYAPASPDTAYEIRPGTEAIGEEALFNCVNLVSVTIPDSVKRIERAGFAYCKALTSVTIPDSVTEMATWAFYSCKALETVTLSRSLTAIEKETFAYCSSLTSVSIPEGVTRIGDSAFEDCTGLLSAIIPDSVAEIGYHVFTRYQDLTHYPLKNLTVTVGKDSFAQEYCEKSRLNYTLRDE